MNEAEQFHILTSFLIFSVYKCLAMERNGKRMREQAQIAYCAWVRRSHFISGFKSGKNVIKLTAIYGPIFIFCSFKFSPSFRK